MKNSETEDEKRVGGIRLRKGRNNEESLFILLVHDIHSVVCATVDEKEHPVTRVIDMMLEDGDTVYFLTAKGKVFYDQLMKEKYIAMTGMSGGEGMDQAEASLHKKPFPYGEQLNALEARSWMKSSKKIPIWPVFIQMMPPVRHWLSFA